MICELLRIVFIFNFIIEVTGTDSSSVTDKQTIITEQNIAVRIESNHHSSEIFFTPYHIEPRCA
jgi:hypothetical protein